MYISLLTLNVIAVSLFLALFSFSIAAETRQYLHAWWSVAHREASTATYQCLTLGSALIAMLPFLLGHTPFEVLGTVPSSLLEKNLVLGAGAIAAWASLNLLTAGFALAMTGALALDKVTHIHRSRAMKQLFRPKHYRY